MAVDDHGIEVLKKSGEEVVAGSKADYYIKVLNPDGMPFEVTPGIPSSASVINTYTEISSIASSTPTTVVSYTVPALKKFDLNLIEFNGENIAEYTVELNGSPIAKKDSYFGGPFHGEFDFKTYPLSAGDVIRLRVEHQRSVVGDFNGRILGVEDDA